jgi:ribose/xylose/arabinose/galactoside ABC-type transport system permease subunit
MGRSTPAAMGAGPCAPVPPHVRWRAPWAWSRIGPYAVLAAIAATAGALSPTLFLRPENLTNLGVQVVALGLVSLGQTLVVLTAGIDLSVAATMSLVDCLAAGIMAGRVDQIWQAVALGVAVGGATGALNGWATVKLSVPPIVVTLGTMSILRGITYLYAPSGIGQAAAPFLEVAQAQVGPVPIALLGLLLLALATSALLRHTRLGRYIYAVGGDAENARRAGVPVDRTTMTVYVLAGVFSALAGLFIVARIGTGLPYAADGFELDSIIAAVLGGTSLFGGVGTAWGTLAGAGTLSVIGNILNLMGIDTFIQQVLKGMIVIIAVSLWSAGVGRGERR